MAAEFEICESKLLKGVYIIKPNKFKDFRGEIYTAFLSEEIDKLLPKPLKFIQDKFTLSHRNVLRGIHGDHKSYKLVTCVWGEIEQVVVDCRKDSPTYLKWEKWTINADNQLIIFVPAGFGNAHCVLSKEAVNYYKCAYLGAYVDAEEQFTYAWNDERIGIDWGGICPILSERDMKHLKDAQ